MESTKFGHHDEPDSGSFSIEDAFPTTLRAANNYELEEEIGRGGTGVVYRAVDVELQREVAVKIMFRAFQDSPDVIQRFVKEAFVMGALKHPVIASVYDCGFTECGLPFSVMNLVQGQTLREKLEQHPLQPAEFLEVMRVFEQVCQGMGYTHRQGVLHLDLKPDNIMIGEFGEVHIMDWGLAKALAPESIVELDEKSGLLLDEESESQHRVVHGTPLYMSPEQAKADDVDKRTDVFCLGAILCRILTGQAPYEGSDVRNILKQAERAQLGPAFERLDGCGADSNLVRLARRCLNPDPFDRPENAEEVAREVKRFNHRNLEQARIDLGRFFELSPTLFCVIGDDGYLRRLNPNLAIAIGYSEQALLSRPFVEFLHEEDQAEILSKFQELKNGLDNAVLNTRWETIDGEIVEIRWTMKSDLETETIYAAGELQ